MTEKKNNVQTVKEQKPDVSNSVADNAEKRAVPSFAEPPVLPATLRDINPSMLEAAKNFGIPLDGIFSYIEKLEAYNKGVEARLNSIVANFEPAVQLTIQKMNEAALQKQQANAPAPMTAPSQGGGMPQAALGFLQQIAPMLQGGGGESIFGKEFQDKAASAMAESFFGDLAMGKTIRNAITQKLTSKLVQDVAGETLAAATG